MKSCNLGWQKKNIAQWIFVLKRKDKYIEVFFHIYENFAVFCMNKFYKVTFNG